MNTINALPKTEAARALTLDEILAVSGGKPLHPAQQPKKGKGKGKGKNQGGLSGLLNDAENAVSSFFDFL